MAITKIYKGSLERTDIQKIYKGTTLLYAIEKLATPQNVTADGTTVSWDAVENATSYEILVSGSSLGTVSTTSVDVSTLPGWGGLPSGDYAAYIIAKADGYADSEPSAAVSVSKGATFKQIFPTTTSDNYTLIENLDKHKIYSIFTWGNVVTIKFTNKWESSNPSTIFIDSQTENSIKFHIRNDGAIFEEYLDGITLEGDSVATISDFEGFSPTAVYAEWICLVEGTAITLADRTTKNIEDITYDDNLLVWDFDNATFTGAKPIWIMKQKKALEYNHLVFSDGSELNTVSQHRIFNVEKGMFTYPMTDDTPIGTTTFNDKGEYITLMSKEIINKEVEYYNVITDYHINLFAGTVLTSCRLSNLYPIEKMRYQKDNRELHDVSMFNELDDKWVNGLRLLEQPLEINRNNSVVYENSLVDYVKRLERNKV